MGPPPPPSYAVLGQGMLGREAARAVSPAPQAFASPRRRDGAVPLLQRSCLGVEMP